MVVLSGTVRQLSAPPPLLYSLITSPHIVQLPSPCSTCLQVICSLLTPPPWGALYTSSCSLTSIVAVRTDAEEKNCVLGSYCSSYLWSSMVFVAGSWLGGGRHSQLGFNEEILLQWSSIEQGSAHLTLWGYPASVWLQHSNSWELHWSSRKVTIFFLLCTLLRMRMSVVLKHSTFHGFPYLWVACRWNQMDRWESFVLCQSC